MAAHCIPYLVMQFRQVVGLGKDRVPERTCREAAPRIFFGNKNNLTRLYGDPFIRTPVWYSNRITRD